MKLPKNAKLVFKGKIFDTYQWDQEMFDGSTEVFERLKRPNTIQVLAIQNDNILIAEEEQPAKGKFHALFGGRQEPNEDSLECAKRELLEESGLTSKDWELYKIYEPYNKMEWEVHFYIARNCQKIAEQKLDSGEKITTKPLTFEQFINFILEGKLWATELNIDILRMLHKGTINEFKQKLFKTNKE